MREPDFPAGEYEQRLERLQAGMRAVGLDAMAFTSEAEFVYFTGFRTLFWQSPTRPWFLVVPLSGKPIALIPEIGAELMRSTWVDDIRTWSSPQPDDEGLSLLADALRDVSRVGMLLGPETALRMPARDFQRLRNSLRGMDVIDASALVQGLRMVKSDQEIEKIRTICGIASRAFAEAPQLFCEGQTLRDAFRDFKIELLRQGADEVPYLVGGAGAGGYTDVISPPDDTPLAKGDVFMLDTGATRQGYFCDFDRNFAIGSASDDVHHAYETLFKATEAALATARPGITCAALYEVMADVIDQNGGDVGRVGHAIGLQLTEPPSLAPFDETVLKAGMVMTLEPSMKIGSGSKIMVHEENIVIQDGAADLLSHRAAPELPVI